MIIGVPVVLALRLLLVKGPLSTVIAATAISYSVDGFNSVISKVLNSPLVSFRLKFLLLLLL